MFTVKAHGRPQSSVLSPQFNGANRAVKANKSGFSLVELSIVLVILGLLTGGILTGQSLIRAAELRKLTTDLNKYRTAMFVFRDKYFALPGDMPNATSFWEAADGSTGTTNACYSTNQSSGTATCNGNGNGAFNVPSYGSEQLLVWKHLSNAGLIAGTFTGIGDGTSGGRNYHIPGENCPSTVDNAGFRTAITGTYAPLHDFPIPSGKQQIRVGKDFGGGTPRAPFLTTEEQWNIDTKLDDGTPGYGVVRSFVNSSTISPGCATTDDATTAKYALGDTSALCTLDFYFSQ